MARSRRRARPACRRRARRARRGTRARRSPAARPRDRAGSGAASAGCARARRAVPSRVRRRRSAPRPSTPARRRTSPTAPGEHDAVALRCTRVAREGRAVGQQRVEVEDGRGRPVAGSRRCRRRRPARSGSSEQVVERVVEAGDEVEAAERGQLAQVGLHERRGRRLACRLGEHRARGVAAGHAGSRGSRKRQRSSCPVPHARSRTRAGLRTRAGAATLEQTRASRRS